MYRCIEEGFSCAMRPKFARSHLYVVECAIIVLLFSFGWQYKLHLEFFLYGVEYSAVSFGAVWGRLGVQKVS